MMMTHLYWIDRNGGRQWQRNCIHVEWEGAVFSRSITQVEQFIIKSLLKLQYFYLVDSWVVKVIAYLNAWHVTSTTQQQE